MVYAVEVEGSVSLDSIEAPKSWIYNFPTVITKTLPWEVKLSVHYAIEETILYIYKLSLKPDTHVQLPLR